MQRPSAAVTVGNFREAQGCKGTLLRKPNSDDPPSQEEPDFLSAMTCNLFKTHSPLYLSAPFAVGGCFLFIPHPTPP